MIHWKKSSIHIFPFSISERRLRINQKLLVKAYFVIILNRMRKNKYAKKLHEPLTNNSTPQTQLLFQPENSCIFHAENSFLKLGPRQRKEFHYYRWNSTNHIPTARLIPLNCNHLHITDHRYINHSVCQRKPANQKVLTKQASSL